MNTKYFDGYGNKISESAFYEVFGAGHNLFKDVDGPNDFPDLSTIQVSALHDSGPEDGRMAVEAVLKIEGLPPVDPGFFCANLAWGPNPGQRASVPFEMKDGLAMVDLIMGAKGWAYDPDNSDSHGPGTIWISAADGVVNSEQVIWVGWLVYTNHRRVARVVFEAFGTDPSGELPPPPPPPPPPIDDRVLEILQQIQVLVDERIHVLVDEAIAIVLGN